MPVLKYQNKPVEIEAIEFVYSKKCIDELKEFLGDNLDKVQKNRHPKAIGEAYILPSDPEGVGLVAIEGDYIVKGPEGNFFPCKPDFFKSNYVQV